MQLSKQSKTYPYHFSKRSATRAMPAVVYEPFEQPERWLRRKFRSMECKHQRAALGNFQNLTSDGRKYKWATVCSGSECPTLWVYAQFRMLRAELLEVDLDSAQADPHAVVVHVFSCEIEKAKQEWIHRHFRPLLMFSDVCALGPLLTLSLRKHI